MKRALVTGGAGLIGSTLSDLLRREGWKVRVLDNLEPQTHRQGRPAWVPNDSDFIEGDLRDRVTITAAPQDTDGVFRRTAAGGLQRCSWTHGAGTVSGFCTERNSSTSKTTPMKVQRTTVSVSTAPSGR